MESDPTVSVHRAQPASGQAASAAPPAAPAARGAPTSAPASPGKQVLDLGEDLVAELAPGLVICAKTRRDLWRDFPSPDLVSAAAGAFVGIGPPSALARAALGRGASPLSRRGDSRSSLAPGLRPQIVVAPGCVAVEWHDWRLRDWSDQRAVDRREAELEARLETLRNGGELPEEQESQREIIGWSRRSRARMVRALCELDYGPLAEQDGLPAMLTLTYPGDWITVAPNGKAAKKHLSAFRLRFRRAWGRDLVAVWKLELQRRGAPHYHILFAVPQGVAKNGMTWKQWASWAWADVVAHPDPIERMNHEGAGVNTSIAEGLRMSDPRRAAVYFTKHGAYAAKEYQHNVPDEWAQPGQGPGRFWGYWGLQRVRAVVEVGEAVAVAVARTMRRWARAQKTTREVRVRRSARTEEQALVLAAPYMTREGYSRPVPLPKAGRYRKVRRPVKRLAHGAGWLSVNDGPAFAYALSRVADQLNGG